MKSKKANKALAMGASTGRSLKEVMRNGAMVAFGSGLAAIVTYKVWNGVAYIDSKIQSGVGRGLAKAALFSALGLGYSMILPAYPMVAAGIAGYGIFMGALDALGYSDTPSLTIPATFESTTARDAFLAANPNISAADRALVMARQIVAPALPQGGVRPANAALRMQAFRRVYGY